jgi:hypothetical protein
MGTYVVIFQRSAPLSLFWIAMYGIKHAQRKHKPRVGFDLQRSRLKGISASFTNRIPQLGSTVPGQF